MPQDKNIRLKSKPTQGVTAASKVDREAGIIHDVVMCQVGEAKGHGMHLEQEFIDALVAYDNANHTKSGLKARFGHPSYSSSTMGSQLGYFKNFRVRGEDAIADLHLLDAANDSPTLPNAKEWMLKMAEEKPDFVMSSIVFRASDRYKRDEKGNKVKPYKYDEDGDMVSNNAYYKLKGKEYVEFDESEGARHLYTDIVEQGAATDHLFATKFNADKGLFANIAVEFLQDNPAIHSFLKDNPAKLIEFAQKADIELPKQKLSFAEKASQLKDWLLGEEQASSDEAHTQALADKDAEIAQLKQELEGEQTALKTATDAHTQALAEKDAEITELSDKVKELEQYVPPETDFEDEGAKPDPDKKELTAFEKEQQQYFNKIYKK